MKANLLRSLCFFFLTIILFSVTLKADQKPDNILTTLAEMQYSNIPPSMFDYFASLSAESIVSELAKKGFTIPVINPQNPDLIATLAGLFKAAIKVKAEEGSEESMIKGLTNLAKISKQYRMRDWTEALMFRVNELKNG